MANIFPHHLPIIGRPEAAAVEPAEQNALSLQPDDEVPSLGVIPVPAIRQMQNQTVETMLRATNSPVHLEKIYATAHNLWNEQFGKFDELICYSGTMDVLRTKISLWKLDSEKVIISIEKVHSKSTVHAEHLTDSRAREAAKDRISDEKKWSELLSSLPAILGTFVEGIQIYGKLTYAVECMNFPEELQLIINELNRDDAGADRGIVCLRNTIEALLKLSKHDLGQEVFTGKGIDIAPYFAEGRALFDEGIHTASGLLQAAAYTIAWLAGSDMLLGNTRFEKTKTLLKNVGLLQEKINVNRLTLSGKQRKAITRTYAELDALGPETDQQKILDHISLFRGLRLNINNAVEASEVRRLNLLSAIDSKLDVAHERLNAARIELALVHLKKCQLSDRLQNTSLYNGFRGAIEDIELDLKILSKCFTKQWYHEDTYGYEAWRIVQLEKMQNSIDAFLRHFHEKVKQHGHASEGLETPADLTGLVASLSSLLDSVDEEIEWGYECAEVLEADKEKAERFIFLHTELETGSWMKSFDEPVSISTTKQKKKKNS